jgi:hypothetical protein
MTTNTYQPNSRNHSCTPIPHPTGFAGNVIMLLRLPIIIIQKVNPSSQGHALSPASGGGKKKNIDTPLVTLTHSLLFLSHTQIKTKPPRTTTVHEEHQAVKSLMTLRWVYIKPPSAIQHRSSLCTIQGRPLVLCVFVQPNFFQMLETERLSKWMSLLNWCGWSPQKILSQYTYNLALQNGLLKEQQRAGFWIRYCIPFQINIINFMNTRQCYKF